MLPGVPRGAEHGGVWWKARPRCCHRLLLPKEVWGAGGDEHDSEPQDTTGSPARLGDSSVGSPMFSTNAGWAELEATWRSSGLRGN